jgi:hypothetical protein
MSASSYTLLSISIIVNISHSAVTPDTSRQPRLAALHSATTRSNANTISLVILWSEPPSICLLVASNFVNGPIINDTPAPPFITELLDNLGESYLSFGWWWCMGEMISMTGGRNNCHVITVSSELPFQSQIGKKISLKQSKMKKIIWLSSPFVTEKVAQSSPTTKTINAVLIIPVAAHQP